MSVRVAVSAELLAWASERARVPASRLADKFPTLPAWVRGEAQPTLKQLESFARATRTPLGYFFLSEPPIERLPIQDFRTMRDEPLRRPSPDLLDTIYECEQRQEWYRDFVRANGEDPISIVGSMAIDDDPVIVGGELRAALRFDVTERGPSWSEALRRLIEHAEDLGVLVMVSGIVGSNTHRPLDPDEFRGFALVDEYAPVVFINGADTKAAQIFTLAHELAHVWLGASALDDAEPGAANPQAVERWCNAVAAELLVPQDAIVEMSIDALDADELDAIAARFRVSTLVVLRRLHDVRQIDDEGYWARYQAERARLAQLMAEAAPRSGGNFYNTQPVRASKRFARALIADTLEGRTLYRDAFRMLGFRKESAFEELARRMGVA